MALTAMPALSLRSDAFVPTPPRSEIADPAFAWVQLLISLIGERLFGRIQLEERMRRGF